MISPGDAQNMRQGKGERVAPGVRGVNPAKSRGRPRVQTATPLVRRNVLVDPGDLARVRALYGSRSDSEALRQALDAILLWHDVDELAGRIASSGGPDDVCRRTAGSPAVPATFDPAMVTEEDKERFADSPEPLR